VAESHSELAKNQRNFSKNFDAAHDSPSPSQDLWLQGLRRGAFCPQTLRRRRRWFFAGHGQTRAFARKGHPLKVGVAQVFTHLSIKPFPVKKTSVILAFALSLAIPLFMASSPKAEKPTESKWRVATVVESVVPGNLGRSKITTTGNSDGATTEQEHQKPLQPYRDQLQKPTRQQAGRHRPAGPQYRRCATRLVEVVPGNFGGDKDSQGIFMTRFIFKK